MTLKTTKNYGNGFCQLCKFAPQSASGNDGATSEAVSSFGHHDLSLAERGYPTGCSEEKGYRRVPPHERGRTMAEVMQLKNV